MKIRRKRKRPLPDRHSTAPAPPASGEGLDAEGVMLAAGLIRLPTKTLPGSFWEMPAPQVSFEDAVSAVTSEREEDCSAYGLW
jgi:hypothetical protein